ncbi:TPA: PTS maltose transporter subunit IICB [Citrobacter koseri]|uniref:maltose/glucose-specific PTS transporter subunit IIBC n=1 Tax=Citrobacter TaxID=544 RepID=UPI000E0776F5|nr:MULTISPECIES: maltose/glucose-specific PTS transporter subunit IIBC [Citrobacter]MCE5351003.1 PTS maltose transporter subunit IICB [Citrobacter koseri]MDM3025800.1 maltose/glucose-specific PTS transporter subunit IIBC [Citrobacter sp. CK194]STA81507.1 bifunctional PTS system maltose and glucose-specific transporter subunits IICB [Citrobacter koseri]STT20054.1 PTS system protein [Citrobacter koseri]HCB2601054.1 PTS maltose transporter subunit IICB [Citrobacter koseri]
MTQEKSFKSRLWEFFQSLGKTFMFPVSLLAFMGLLLGVGSSITSPSTIKSFPFLGGELTQLTFGFIAMVGGFAFTYLPVMFAIAIPMGMAKRNKAVGAFSGFVGYMLMNMSINYYLTATHQIADAATMKQVGQSIVLGIQTLEMGVLGGIIAGVITYFLHERFQDTVLHDAFAFFSGIRFVPIITSLTMSLVGLAIPLLWTYVAMGIAGIGHIIQSTSVFGPFLYGVGVLLLKPFGLHHILAMVRFTPAGGTEFVNSHEVAGALNIFYAELKAGLPFSPHVTAFLSQGFMPTFIFGLPAVAYAIYRTAKPENRPVIKGLLLSGVLVSVITGISEPIEFLFLFIAPALYVFHIVMSGLALMVMAILGVTIGNTDGGILDLLIFGVMQGTSTKWYLLFPVGIVWFGIYFFVFRWYILKHDIKTPGREDSSDDAAQAVAANTKARGKSKYDHGVILNALGGKENIDSLDNCITRLRLVVKDMSKVDQQTLKNAGALSVVVLDAHSVQVIIGPQVQSVKTGIEALI